MATGEDAPSLEEKVRFLQDLRRHSEELGRQADRFLVDQVAHLHQGLIEAQENQKKLKAVLEKLSATPWHPAVFLRPVATPLGQRVMVMHGSSRRVVELADGVDLDSLAIGDEVFLGNELNVVMGKSPCGIPQCGETAFFDRYTSDRRLVLKWRDEVPDIGREQVGGQEANLETLLSTLTTILVAPDKAQLYGLGGRQSILMVGPPGCGKTLMARVAASEIARLSGKRCRFGVVKPAEWESPWVGETQQNIRNCFKALREAAQDGFAVLFLDEIEAVGRIRGSVIGHHSDKFLAALLAELDGFTDRGGVAIIAATNRKDMVDPALLERLSDVEIHVSRPDMRGARAIFQIHLPESLPYSPNGASAEDTRLEIIETAVSRFYSPNAENELCILRFRDGKTRTVTARELASGRIFEQICRAARQAAFLRDVRGGEPGLRVADIENAVSHAMKRLASTLSLRNVHAYLSDLPQDVDVVSVEPVVRKVSRPHRYLHAA
jgi:ATP-dependent 26S proteasome regulatory subunit